MSIVTCAVCLNQYSDQGRGRGRCMKCGTANAATISHVVSAAAPPNAATISHVVSAAAPPSVNVGTKRWVACPGCGETGRWSELHQAVNQSFIDWIDADTGEVHWSGETELGDSGDFISFQCTNCGHEIKNQKAFDPTAKIAEMMAGLEALAEEYEHE